MTIWHIPPHPVYLSIAAKFCPALTSDNGDLAGLIARGGAGLAMKKIKPPRRVPQQPLAAGQLWRMPEANLQVGMVGKLLVHYKLGKPNAVRVPNSCNGIKAVEKYLKTHKAVLD
jgi:hypothetical protein